MRAVQRILSFVAAAGFGALLLPIQACGGTSSDCTDICTQRQQGDCPGIKGDCSNFCDAATTVGDESSCGPDFQNLVDCYESNGACANNCGAEFDKAASCYGSYCQAHSTDESCNTVIDGLAG